MLHLLPIRGILFAIIACVALAILTAFYVGWVGGGDATQDIALLLRWSSTAATGLIIILFAAWRWIPTVQHLVFPYLGGHWSGILTPQDNRPRDVTLEIKHTLFGLRLVLDSAESTSWTIVVHAERDPDFNRYRLYYVYLNERKEGTPGAGDRYRGLAVIRVELAGRPRLLGDYFTETHRRGTLELRLDAAHPWWKLWR